MKKLQFTPIVHGELLTEEFIRNMRAQNYIDRVSKRRRKMLGEAICNLTLLAIFAGIMVIIII